MIFQDLYALSRSTQQLVIAVSIQPERYGKEAFLTVDWLLAFHSRSCYHLHQLIESCLIRFPSIVSATSPDAPILLGEGFLTCR